MELELFDYDLPAECIAQAPLADRSAARLFRLDRATGTIEHRTVRELPGMLRAGDLLVLNDTAVVPARLDLRRESGGRVGGLFLRETYDGHWEVLLNGRGRLRVGERLLAAGRPDVSLTLERRLDAGQWEASVAEEAPGGLRPRPSAFGPYAAGSAVSLLSRIGQTPLPPYIRREREQADDRGRYQTVFARRPGAVAAPTAGLHFTEALLAELADAGVEQVKVTLHVGLGTFEPIRVPQIERHRMHSEWFECPAATADAVNAARSGGRRVVAVGTTSVRVLESCFDDAAGRLRPRTGWTDLFIFPGYRFRAVDAMLTNFHLPRSSLLMLAAAFAGRERILAAYGEAISAGYRFYSYGDAMLIE